MWDPHKAHIGHNYFHLFKKIVLVKENVTFFHESYFSSQKKFKGLFMDNYFRTLSYGSHMGPS